MEEQYTTPVGINTMALVAMAQNGQAVTTTLAIAQGTEIDHASVIKLARTYLSDLEEFGPIRFEIQLANTPQGGGRPTEYATLNEQQAMVILTYMRNSDIVRAFKKSLVKAFWELAKQTHQLNPANLSRMQLLNMAMEAEQERMELACQVEELTPKAVALDRIATADEGAMCPTDAAKHLQVKPSRLFLWLQQNGWIYKRTGSSNWLAYQPRIQQGVLQHKVITISLADGGEKVCERVLVTPKGIALLAKALGGIPQESLS